MPEHTVTIILVRSSPSEMEESEAFSWYVKNLKVLDCSLVVQVAAVVSATNFHPRGHAV